MKKCHESNGLICFYKLYTFVRWHCKMITAVYASTGRRVHKNRESKSIENRSFVQSNLNVIDHNIFDASFVGDLFTTQMCGDWQPSQAVWIKKKKKKKKQIIDINRLWNVYYTTFVLCSLEFVCAFGYCCCGFCINRSVRIILIWPPAKMHFKYNFGMENNLTFFECIYCIEFTH